MHTVCEHHLRDRANVRGLDLLRAVKSSLGLRSPGAHEVRAVAVDLERNGDLCDEPQDLAGQIHLGDCRDCLGDVRAHVLLVVGVLAHELVRVVLPVGSLLDDGDALVEVADALDVNAKPEAVEQLRPQLTFLRVHGADEDEPRRVRN